MLKRSVAVILFMTAVLLFGVTDIKTAITNSDLVLVKSMIEGNKDLLESRIDTYFTPLNYAALEGKTDIVKYLVDKGADINTRDREGSIPLQNAAIKGYFEIVKILVENGSDVNYKDYNDVTPLHFACMSGNLEMIKFLESKGANLKGVNSNGNTPLH
ncbi:MAG: ankyrin repeat domain-containing protein, partial [Candidatus Delongbacteria bacterium]|nr:ankyrin repeat domain-containing protein [Candidatus Delongbacteria bacterium]